MPIVIFTATGSLGLCRWNAENAEAQRTQRQSRKTTALAFMDTNGYLLFYSRFFSITY